MNLILNMILIGFCNPLYIIIVYYKKRVNIKTLKKFIDRNSGASGKSHHATHRIKCEKVNNGKLVRIKSGLIINI